MAMHTTPRTCRQCKASKKKCDRAKPICARCSRLSLPCAFDGDIESPSADIATKFEKVFERLEKLESQGCDPGKQQRASANTTITHDTNTIKWQLSPGLFQPSYMEVIASANVSHVLEKKNITMLDVAGKHLGTLCSFLPIISQERFSNRLHEAQELKPHGSFSILSLAIVLLTEDSISHPGGTPSSLKPVSEAYQVCKYHYSLLCSLNDPSIELIQAGLCIALYEHLQVIGDQEYLTIGGCARMASLLRLSPHISIMSEMASRHLPWEFSPISEPFDITGAFHNEYNHKAGNNRIMAVDLGHFKAEAEATHILYSLRKILHRDKPKELNETQIKQVTALGQRLEYLRAKVQNCHASHAAWRSELATILV
ncbi:hypothetical protein ANOM_011477 [Aspergillus nomiae NRRL 13137]|uniref:Zn(2)-C6 fungal-type domain-containing protein n=1 Tax=Aspergillus nomiae NRRL (strain ATCC 15546 / NRRL 13137 / CBS 260.88 / M93) TaxID=1509407 RepID=A0A0L1IKI5_ASPN3|nr:uncharacterized protein ANOM_011477 [Aspergillus nomiae NRRL 13137]KNG80074.1 hypothetical protein ANOM_011477 [Aspergillus nomiae NRRL 13137]